MSAEILPAEPGDWRHVPAGQPVSGVLEALGLARARDVSATLVWVPVTSDGDP